MVPITGNGTQRNPALAMGGRAIWCCGSTTCACEPNLALSSWCYFNGHRHLYLILRAPFCREYSPCLLSCNDLVWLVELGEKNGASCCRCLFHTSGMVYCSGNYIQRSRDFIRDIEIFYSGYRRLLGCVGKCNRLGGNVVVGQT